MEQYIKDLTYVIQNGEMENTYKMAWIRSIVETCVLDPNVQEIQFDHLSKLIFGYYWNQTIYFDLEQSPNPLKRPVIYQIVKEEISEYRHKNGKQPVWFSGAENSVSIPVSKISTILSKDVCWRFPKVGKENFDLYDLDIKSRTIILHRTDLIREYANVLFDVINYRWTQKLEEFNHSPRISQKVRGTDRENIRRKSLAKFRKYLDLENPDHVCFHTGRKIKYENLSIDHVLPWSYLFSDNLWNLVYVDKSFNSSKGNIIPKEETIEKLENRNIHLLKSMEIEFPNTKVTDELKLSIETDLIRKSWVGCK
jgi:5-methylcytosine-specific restriction endonuclease McrA